MSRNRRRPHQSSRLTYANVMSTAAVIVAVASAATRKPVRKSVKRLRKRAQRKSPD
jgi:hypothetical protein